MPEGVAHPKKIIIKGGRRRKFPPKTDYGGKPPGPQSDKPKRK